MKPITSKIIAVILAVISVFSIAVPAMAADIQNSTGSKATDIAVLGDSSYSVAGKDSTQNKQSQYDVYTYNGNDIISSVNVYGTIAEGSKIYDPTDPDADDDGFVNGEIQVGVPTTIIFSGTPNAKGEYVGNSSGKVKGNISGSTVINVVPDDAFTLSSEGKKDISATVEQDYTKFVISTSEVSGEKVNKHVTPKFNDKAVFNVAVKTTEATAGSWQGSFNYNISLTNSASEAIGTKVTSWNISATENDNVWMTYYQPETNATRSMARANAVVSAESTSIEKYENGTVVIRGTGNMEENVNKHFYNFKAMSEEANTRFWDKISTALTEEELATFLEYVPEGTAVYYYSSASNLYMTEFARSLPEEIRTIADKASKNYTADAGKYLLYSPKTIIIEDGVTNISEGAFTNSYELSSVIIGATVKTIGRSAFTNCRSLTSVSVPDSVTTIGYFAFMSCKSMKDITLGENVNSVYPSAFDNLNATIHCPNQSIADMVNASFRTGSISTVVVD